MNLGHRDRIDDVRIRLRALANLVATGAEVECFEGIASLIHGLTDDLDQIAAETNDEAAWRRAAS